MATERNSWQDGSTKADLEKFYALVDQIEIAMMTTRRPDGHLESRAMANQKRATGADLWFVTAADTGKLRDLEADPHVNLSSYKDRTREWLADRPDARCRRDAWDRAVTIRVMDGIPRVGAVRRPAVGSDRNRWRLGVPFHRGRNRRRRRRDPGASGNLPACSH